jgi:predicted nucleic acid-binding protein
VLDDERQPPLVPAAVLCEVGHLAARRYGSRAIDAFLGDLDSGALKLDSGERDVGRARELVSRYTDLRLGVTDAFVAVCAERNGGRVLTLDRRHFDVLSRELALTVLP